jgi:hypothetical protein
LDPSLKHNGLGVDTGALCQIVTKIPVVLSGIVEDIQSQSHDLPLVTHTIGLANESPHKRSGFVADERQRLPAEVHGFHRQFALANDEMDEHHAMSFKKKTNCASAERMLRALRRKRSNTTVRAFGESS